MFQFHANWIGYRAAAETLRQHGFRYAARVAPYAGPDRRDALAEALGEVITGENAVWVTSMRQSGERPAPGGGT